MPSSFNCTYEYTRGFRYTSIINIFADGKVRLAPDIPQVVLRLAPEEGVIEIRPLAGLFDDVTEDDYEV